MQIVSERLFEVKAGSHTCKAIQAYLDARQLAADAWGRFCEKYGAEQYFAGDSLQGLLFDHGKQPEGWINPKHIGHSKVYRPNLRDRACKDAAQEFRALPSKPSSFKWLEMLDIPLHVGDRRSFKTPGFKKIEGTYYLTATEGCAVPDDVDEVPGKEVVRLLEVHERELNQPTTPDQEAASDE